MMDESGGWLVVGWMSAFYGMWTIKLCSNKILLLLTMGASQHGLRLRFSHCCWNVGDEIPPSLMTTGDSVCSSPCYFHANRLVILQLSVVGRYKWIVVLQFSISNTFLWIVWLSNFIWNKKVPVSWNESEVLDGFCKFPSSLHHVPKSVHVFIFWITLSKINQFWQVRWTYLYDFYVKFSLDLTYQKLLKSVNFWQKLF